MKQKPKQRTALSVRREIERIERLRPKVKRICQPYVQNQMMGMTQALYWVLRDNAASPSSCLDAMVSAHRKAKR